MESERLRILRGLTNRPLNADALAVVMVDYIRTDPEVPLEKLVEYAHEDYARAQEDQEST